MPESVLVTHEYIGKVLAGNPEPGTRLVEPFATLARESGFPMKILEDVATKNDAEVHVEEGDLWYCIEGTVQFTYGGKLSQPHFRKNSDGSENLNELFSKAILGGIEVTLHPGDWLFIPPGEPHQHGTAGVARLGIIKIPKK